MRESKKLQCFIFSLSELNINLNLEDVKYMGVAE
jgi:hypothetical protein